LGWVVGLLWDDLYDWHQWFLKARLLPLPTRVTRTGSGDAVQEGGERDERGERDEGGLICLGSNIVDGFHDWYHKRCEDGIWAGQ
jgi:hypothetical protein